MDKNQIPFVFFFFVQNQFLITRYTDKPTLGNKSSQRLERWRESSSSSSYPSNAISINLLTPECSKTSSWLASGSKTTLKANDRFILAMVSTTLKIKKEMQSFVSSFFFWESIKSNAKKKKNLISDGHSLILWSRESISIDFIQQKCRWRRGWSITSIWPAAGNVIAVDWSASFRSSFFDVWCCCWCCFDCWFWWIIDLCAFVIMGLTLFINRLQLPDCHRSKYDEEDPNGYGSNQ